MDTEDSNTMNGDDSWKGIIAEGGHLLPQESGKDSTSPKEGGKTAGKEVISCAMSQNRSLAGVGKANRGKYRGRSRKADTMKVCCIITRSRGRLVLPAMSMVILLELTMAEYWRREY